MNTLQRFQAFSRRQAIDRPLRYARFSSDLAQRLAHALGTEEFIAHFDMDEPARIWPAEPPGYEAPDFSAYYEDLPPGDIHAIDPLGVARRKGSLYHFTERVSPLRNATSFAELEAYPINDFAEWDTIGMRAAVEQAHQAGRFAVVWAGHMYESAWQVRGYEPFLADMAERPEWCEVLLDRFMEKNLNLAVAGARAGVDLLHFGDDVANQNSLMFSPPMWRRFMKSRWVKVCAAAKEINPDIQIRYHSDGNIRPIFDELLEIGFTIINPLQPECLDLDDIARAYGGRVFFDGGIGTQTVMPFGSTDDVRACVRERVAQFGQEIILAPTHVLEPEVPIDNIKAFFEACDEARRMT